MNDQLRLTLHNNANLKSAAIPTYVHATNADLCFPEKKKNRPKTVVSMSESLLFLHNTSTATEEKLIIASGLMLSLLVLYLKAEFYYFVL